MNLVRIAAIICAAVMAAPPERPPVAAPELDGGTDWLNTASPIKLKDLRGQPVVLYFYPRDDTPGCTKEACAFRDRKKELTKLGAREISRGMPAAKSSSSL